MRTFQPQRNNCVALDHCLHSSPPGAIIERKFVPCMVMERSCPMDYSPRNSPCPPALPRPPAWPLRSPYRLLPLLTVIHAADNKPKAPGLGDPGRLARIEIESGRLQDGQVTIAGRDAGQQLVVTGIYDSGQTRDWTRKVTYEVAPAGIVRIDAAGLIDPHCRRRSDCPRLGSA